MAAPRIRRVEAIDPNFATFWSTRLDDDDNPRAIFLDESETKEVINVQVSVTPGAELSGEQMVEMFSADYSTIGK